MLENLLNFVNNILDTLSDIAVLAFSFVSDLANLASNVGNAFTIIPSVLGAFPSAFTSGITAIISVAIIYKILGREG